VHIIQFQTFNYPCDIIEVTNILWARGKLYIISILKALTCVGNGVKFALSSFAEICGTSAKGESPQKVIFSTWRRVGGKSIIEVDLVGRASTRQFSLFYISIRATRPRVGDKHFRFHGYKMTVAPTCVEIFRSATNR